MTLQLVAWVHVYGVLTFMVITTFLPPYVHGIRSGEYKFSAETDTDDKKVAAMFLGLFLAGQIWFIMIPPLVFAWVSLALAVLLRAFSRFLLWLTKDRG